MTKGSIKAWWYVATKYKGRNVVIGPYLSRAEALKKKAEVELSVMFKAKSVWLDSKETLAKARIALRKIQKNKGLEGRE